MYCLDYVERPHPGNQLSFMLHELVFLGCHSKLASYPYTFTSHSHSCKILQLFVASTVQMHSDAIFFSIGASRIKTFIKNQCFFINNCRFGRTKRIHLKGQHMHINACKKSTSIYKVFSRGHRFIYSKYHRRAEKIKTTVEEAGLAAKKSKLQ